MMALEKGLCEAGTKHLPFSRGSGRESSTVAPIEREVNFANR